MKMQSWATGAGYLGRDWRVVVVGRAFSRDTYLVRKKSGRGATKLVTPLLSAILIVALLPGSAQAQQASISDERDGDLAAKYDIRRVTLNSTDRRLKVRVTVRDMSSRNVMLNLRFRDGRGAPHYVRIFRNTQFGEGHDVLVQQDASDPDLWTSYLCRGLRQQWLRKKGQIVLSLPHSAKHCGGGAYDRFKIYTGPWGAGEVSDLVRRRGALTPG